ncbi:MAG: hypothetical protein SNG49_06205, partial [Rikenellaceae bacterium]
RGCFRVLQICDLLALCAFFLQKNAFLGGRAIDLGLRLMPARAPSKLGYGKRSFPYISCYSAWGSFCEAKK